MENIAAVKGQKRGKNLKEKIFPKTPQAGPGDVFGPVWLTDEPKEARSLLASGECVAFVLTQENRGQDLSGISWCFAPEEGVPWEQDPIRAIGQEELYRVWQRRKGLPWHIADTKRLSLRETVEEDGAILYEIQKDAQEAGFVEPLEADPAVRREKIRAYRSFVYGFYGFGIWTVFLRESGRVIGRAGLEIQEGSEEPFLGFVIHPRERRKGYAGEACRAVLEYGFAQLDLPVVRARVHRDNRASLRLCRKLGFRAEKEAPTPDSAWVDFLLRREDFSCSGIV